MATEARCKVCNAPEGKHPYRHPFQALFPKRPTSNMLEAPKCSCGYPEGTFACKIRHVQLNTGDAKAAKD